MLQHPELSEEGQEGWGDVDAEEHMAEWETHEEGAEAPHKLGNGHRDRIPHDGNQTGYGTPHGERKIPHSLNEPPHNIQTTGRRHRRDPAGGKKNGRPAYAMPKCLELIPEK